MRNKSETIRKIVTLWNEGDSIEEIAEKLQLVPSTVRQALNSRGYSLAGIPKSVEYRLDFQDKWDAARARVLEGLKRRRSN